MQILFKTLSLSHLLGLALVRYGSQARAWLRTVMHVLGRPSMVVMLKRKSCCARDTSRL